MKNIKPDSSVGRHDWTGLVRADRWRCVFIRTASFNNIFEAVFPFFDSSDMSLTWTLNFVKIVIFRPFSTIKY
ncbi:hypothetical protein BpHYR1_036897 [Brachionus plicatilis]|uniref:Uncharacterized protein n=1 Tax=Brachionus plicatilis TaxID=10195 RepID=A0A3M7R2F6_BRAPC|nr:hypothetical protein BpHYR1_036897 [Brachionus plicatilis]